MHTATIGSGRMIAVAMAVLAAAAPAPADVLTHGTDLVVLGRIDSVRALELEPCPEDDDPPTAPRCGSILVADVRAEQFLRGSRRDRLEVYFPRRDDDPELAGMRAALFLEKHGGELWVAEGRTGLVVSREAFVELAIDRLRVALAMAPDPEREEKDGPSADLPQVEERIHLAGTEDVSLPTVIKSVKPVYPDPARRARVTGKVILNAVIGTDGRVTDIEVLESARPGWGLEIAAVRAVSERTYEPARLKGRTVRASTTLVLDFVLTGADEEEPAGDVEQDPGPGPYALGPRALEEAIAALSPVALDLAPGDLPVLESEERAIRWAFAKYVKASKEGNLSVLADLIHPELLEKVREGILEGVDQPEAEEALTKVFGTSDRAVIESMTSKEMWIRLGTMGQEQMLAYVTKASPTYLGVVAEGEDLRHVTHRIRQHGQTAVTVLTFKKDGADWKLFFLVPDFGAEGEEGAGEE